MALVGRRSSLGRVHLVGGGPKDGLKSSCKRRQKSHYGGLAQLVEHLLCKQGVTGSSPVSSTMGS